MKIEPTKSLGYVSMWY